MDKVESVPAAEGAELSEQQLDGAAGGSTANLLQPTLNVMVDLGYSSDQPRSIAAPPLFLNLPPTT